MNDKCRNLFRVDRRELITCCFLIYFQAMASVTVETVTVLLVGMETDVNSSVTSAHGRASGDARLQMAKSAATEVCLLCSKASIQHTALVWDPILN